MTNIALIGCGRWGRNLARNLDQLGALGMIVDSELPKTGLPPGLTAPLHRDVADALTSAEIDGVVIAVPAVQHADVVRQALMSGKHVFVEKPLAMNVEEAEQLAILAKAKGLILMVGHLLQYHPGFRRLVDAVSAGEIGRIRHIASNRLNPGAIRTEENALWSLAPHDFSMVLALADRAPTQVNALPVRVVDPRIPDRYVVAMTFHDALTATVDVSWLSPYKEHRLTVLGETGALILDDHAEDQSRRLVLYRNYVDKSPPRPSFVKQDGEPLPFNGTEPLRAEMEAFISAVEKGGTVPTGPEEAIPVLRLLQEAELSARQW